MSFLPESDDLGELLFSRRESVGAALVLVGFGAVLVFFLGAESLIFGGMFWVLGIFLILPKTQFHEFGIVISCGPFRWNKLLYKDIHKMTCYAVRVERDLPLPDNHSFTLKLYPRSNRKWLPRFPKTHNSITSRYDAEMSNVRDRISYEIAKELIKDLDARGEVRWTNKVTIGRTSVNAIVSHLLILSRPIELNYCDIESFEIDDYVFKIYPFDKRMPEISIACGAENFFPCLVVFESLLSRHRSSPNIE